MGASRPPGRAVCRDPHRRRRPRRRARPANVVEVVCDLDGRGLEGLDRASGVETAVGASRGHRADGRLSGREDPPVAVMFDLDIGAGRRRRAGRPAHVRPPRRQAMKRDRTPRPSPRSSAPCSPHMPEPRSPARGRRRARAPRRQPRTHDTTLQKTSAGCAVAPGPRARAAADRPPGAASRPPAVAPLPSSRADAGFGTATAPWRAGCWCRAPAEMELTGPAAAARAEGQRPPRQLCRRAARALTRLRPTSPARPGARRRREAPEEAAASPGALFDCEEPRRAVVRRGGRRRPGATARRR